MQLHYNTPALPEGLDSPKNLYVVYAHYVDDHIIYVGSGSVKRAFSTKRRNNTWHELAQEAKSLDVYFLDVSENAPAIRQHERKLIQRLKPLANRYLNPLYSMPEEFREARSRHSLKMWETRVADPRCGEAGKRNFQKFRDERAIPILRSDGVSFPSLSAASKALKCSHNTVRKYLANGKPFKGYTFHTFKTNQTLT